MDMEIERRPKQCVPGRGKSCIRDHLMVVKMDDTFTYIRVGITKHLHLSGVV